MGAVDVTGSVESSPSYWFRGPYRFVLANAAILPFTPH